MSKQIDLNVDIGEGFPFDAALLEFATSANICCGVHAGNLGLTRETVELCKTKGVRYGMHPGYPDPETMGRRSPDPTEQKRFFDSIMIQIGNFPEGASYIKPHGAFYNDTAVILPRTWEFGISGNRYTSRYEAGGAFLAQYPGINYLTLLLRIRKLPLLGLPQTAHAILSERAGFGFIREGFADRAYQDDGRLVPRSEPGAVLDHPALVAAQVLRLVENVDSICLHGDGEHCLEFAELVRKTLFDAGYEVCAPTS